MTAAARAARSVLALAIWSPVVVLPVLWALDDVALRDVLLFGLVVVVLGTAPGVVLWRAIRPGEGTGSWAEDLMVGFAVGLALGLGGQLAAVAAGVPALAFVIPLLPLLVLAVPGLRGRVRASTCEPAPWWVHAVGAASTVGPVATLRTWYATQDVEPGPLLSVPYVDSQFHLTLVGQLLERGPVSSPALQGQALDYHWFTHGWMAWASALTDVEPAVVLLRLHPLLMPLVVSLAVLGTTRRVSGSWAACTLAAPLTFLTAQANVFPGFSLQSAMTPASPTLGPGVPLTLAVLVALLLRWRGEARTAALLLAAGLAFVAACTKGSTLPPLIAGVALAAVAGLVWRHRGSRVIWVDLAVLIGVLLVSLFAVFRGAAGGIRVDVVESLAQTTLVRIVWPDREAVPFDSLLVMGGVTAFVGSLARAAGLAILAVDGRARREPALWVSLGAALAGATAVVLLWHPGASQVYFLLSAIPLVAVGSAAGLERLLRGVRPWWLRVVAVAVPAAVALVATIAVPRTRAITNTRPVPGSGGRTPMAVVNDAVGDAIALARTGLVVLAIGVVVILAVVLIAKGRRLATLGLAVAVLGVAGGWGSAWQPARAIVERAGRPVPQQPVLAPGGEERRQQLSRALAFSQEQVDAARFIRANAEVDDVVMTNRHCITPQPPVPACDTRRWLVSAFSQRQAFIESWAYTSTAVRLYPESTTSIKAPYWEREDLFLNENFYTAPTPDAARQLWCRGVRWVYVDRLLPTSPGGLDRFAPVRYSNVDAEVRELTAPAGDC